MKCAGWINAATNDCKDLATALSETCTEWAEAGKALCKKTTQQAMQKCAEEVDKSKKKCTDWADEVEEKCKEKADQGSEQCSQWADEGWEECGAWADEGYAECGEWADYGYEECSEWQDWGHSVCCSWKPCKWFCDALVWIASWVCTAAVWIASWVCNFYYWIASWVCKWAYWVANVVCQGWYWLEKWVCVAWAKTVKSFCIAWAYGTKLVCKAVSGAVQISCKAGFDLANGICQVASWDFGVFCTILSWFAKLACLFFTLFVCSINRITSLIVRRATGQRIKHIFVLMLENRSFDHMLGFSNLTGFDPKTGGGVALNGTSMNAGNFRKDKTTIVNASNDAVFKLPFAEEDPPHEFEHIIQQLCGAGVQYDPSKPYPPITMTGFVEVNEAKSPSPETVMRCFNKSTLPVLHALAEEYAVCDNWFSSLPGPTWPNRFFTHAASSGGLDGSPGGFVLATKSAFNGYRFANGTIFDRLEENCLDWEIFEGDETPQSFAMSGMNLYALMGRFTSFDEFEEKINDDEPPIYGFIEPAYGHFLPGGHEDDYTCGTSQHPVDDVTSGEKLIKKVYETLRRSRIWNESVLIITYDEHGGFFDHVVPPSAVPPGDQPVPSYVQHQFDFTQLGVRVPAVVVSPLIRQKTIDHTRYDHTSILATIERIHGLAPLTARDKAANDLLHLFTLEDPRIDIPQIPDPPPSGFICDDVETGTISTQSTVAPEEAAPLPENLQSNSTTWGFLHVAARREYKSAPYRKRREIRRRYEAIRTERDLYEEMAAAKQRLRAARIARRAVKER